MYQLSLSFSGKGSPELIKTEFITSDEHLVCVRGRTSGAFHNCGTFLWTNGVRAISLLCVRAIRLGYTSVLLEGGRGTLASSLDYAITKEPLWVYDFLGCDPSGRPRLRRFLIRTNSNRKRSGPVSFSIARAFLDTQIHISWDDKPITSLGVLMKLERCLGLPYESLETMGGTAGHSSSPISNLLTAH